MLDNVTGSGQITRFRLIRRRKAPGCDDEGMQLRTAGSLMMIQAKCRTFLGWQALIGEPGVSSPSGLTNRMATLRRSGVGHGAGMNHLKIRRLTPGRLPKTSVQTHRFEIPGFRMIYPAAKDRNSVGQRGHQIGNPEDLSGVGTWGVVRGGVRGVVRGVARGGDPGFRGYMVADRFRRVGRGGLGSLCKRSKRGIHPSYSRWNRLS